MLFSIMIIPLLLGEATGKLEDESPDFCNICSDHTMCIYKGQCSEILKRGLSNQEIQNILHTHNDFRNKIALGQESLGAPGPQPKSANMKKMIWNDELALIAQKWADQCTFGHDKCRNTVNSLVGQNLHMYGTNSRGTASNWTRAIQNWYNEVKYFNSSQLKSFKPDDITGHYTQVVWAASFQVGCGYSLFPKGSFMVHLHVCNYSPSGNIYNMPIYDIGTPCSNCKNSLCDSSFTGLCLPHEKENHFISPRKQAVYEKQHTQKLF